MDVVSKREKPKYSHNGHQYVFDKLTKDGSKKMWRCDRKDHGCKARLHTDAATDDVIGDHPVHSILNLVQPVFDFLRNIGIDVFFHPSHLSA